MKKEKELLPDYPIFPLYETHPLAMAEQSENDVNENRSAEHDAVLQTKRWADKNHL